MEEEDSEGGGWLISYADLMTLLFAAFVVLYGITPQGESNNVLGIIASVREAFIEIPDIIPQEKKEGDIKFGDYVFKGFYGDSIESLRVKRYIDADTVNAKIDRDKSLVRNLLNRLATKKQQQDLNLRRAMQMLDHEKGFSIRLMGSYFFEANSYRFTREGRRRFIRLGRLLNQVGEKITIEGHTDANPPSPPFNNQSLGSLRAGRAAQLLTVDAGISPLVLKVLSYGDRRPIGDNRTAEGRNKNRRIEIKIDYF